MTSLFPLYDTIRSLKEKNALNKVQKRELIQKIQQLDSDGHNKIIALIIFHQEKAGKRYKIPELTTPMTIQLSALPDELQVMLDIFCERHARYMLNK